MRIFIFLCVLLLCPVLAESWNSTGHQLIAYLAYQQLTPKVRQHVDDMTWLSNHRSAALNRFLQASTWADSLRFQDINTYNAWHFIDFPFARDGIHPATHPAQENIVWALQQSETILSSPRASRYEKARFLKFLVHFVGDAHQPMHCIDGYSNAHTQGDRGGNGFSIRSEIADNLHAFWDRGLGLLWIDKKNRRESGLQRIAHLVPELDEAGEDAHIQKACEDLDPQHWVAESFQLAKRYGYALQEGSVPSARYIEAGRHVVRRQVLLGGCRLARLINRLFEE